MKITITTTRIIDDYELKNYLTDLCNYAHYPKSILELTKGSVKTTEFSTVEPIDGNTITTKIEIRQ